MPKVKLPKGARSLGDIARMRGKGGELLRALRSGESEMIGFSGPTESGFRAGKNIQTLSSSEGQEVEKMYEAQRKVGYKKPEVVASRKLSDISSARLSMGQGTPHPPQKFADLIGSSSVRAGLKRIAKIAKATGKLTAIGQLLTLPSQIEEYKEMMKPLHKREGERGGQKA